jgi:transposase-like protein
MTKKRRQYDAQYKFRVALEAAKGTKTISELASETGIHPNQIGAWKRQLLEGGSTLFQRNGAQPGQAQAEEEAELYEQIGRLKMELEWLKKKVAPFH